MVIETNINKDVATLVQQLSEAVNLPPPHIIYIVQYAIEHDLEMVSIYDLHISLADAYKIHLKTLGPETKTLNETDKMVAALKGILAEWMRDGA